jgi:hypothetical protein
MRPTGGQENLVASMSGTLMALMPRDGQEIERAASAIA